jgi:hypothetical protein
MLSESSSSAPVSDTLCNQLFRGAHRTLKQFSLHLRVNWTILTVLSQRYGAAESQGAVRSLAMATKADIFLPLLERELGPQ